MGETKVMLPSHIMTLNVGENIKPYLVLRNRSEMSRGAFLNFSECLGGNGIVIPMSNYSSGIVLGVQK